MLKIVSSKTNKSSKLNKYNEERVRVHNANDVLSSNVKGSNTPGGANMPRKYVLLDIDQRNAILNNKEVKQSKPSYFTTEIINKIDEDIISSIEKIKERLKEIDDKDLYEIQHCSYWIFLNCFSVEQKLYMSKPVYGTYTDEGIFDIKKNSESLESLVKDFIVTKYIPYKIENGFKEKGRDENTTKKTIAETIKDTIEIITEKAVKEIKNKDINIKDIESEIKDYIYGMIEYCLFGSEDGLKRKGKVEAGIYTDKKVEEIKKEKQPKQTKNGSYVLDGGTKRGGYLLVPLKDGRYKKIIMAEKTLKEAMYEKEQEWFEDVYLPQRNKQLKTLQGQKNDEIEVVVFTEEIKTKKIIIENPKSEDVLKIDEKLKKIIEDFVKENKSKTSEKISGSKAITAFLNSKKAEGYSIEKKKDGEKTEYILNKRKVFNSTNNLYLTEEEGEARDAEAKEFLSGNYKAINKEINKKYKEMYEEFKVFIKNQLDQVAPYIEKKLLYNLENSNITTNKNILYSLINNQIKEMLLKEVDILTKNQNFREIFNGLVGSNKEKIDTIINYFWKEWIEQFEEKKLTKIIKGFEKENLVSNLLNEDFLNKIKEALVNVYFSDESLYNYIKNNVGNMTEKDVDEISKDNKYKVLFQRYMKELIKDPYLKVKLSYFQPKELFKIIMVYLGDEIKEDWNEIEDAVKQKKNKQEDVEIKKGAYFKNKNGSIIGIITMEDYRNNTVKVVYPDKTEETMSYKEFQDNYEIIPEEEFLSILRAKNNNQTQEQTQNNASNIKNYFNPELVKNKLKKVEIISNEILKKVFGIEADEADEYAMLITDIEPSTCRVKLSLYDKDGEELKFEFTELNPDDESTPFSVYKTGVKDEDIIDMLRSLYNGKVAEEKDVYKTVKEYRNNRYYGRHSRLYEFDENDLKLSAANDNEEELLDAINDDEVFDDERDRVNVVRTLLEEGTDPNSRDEEGKTPLMLAVISGLVNVAKLLLSYGADVNAQDNEGTTALMFAAVTGSEKLTKLLLEAGANIHIKNKFNITAYMYAATHKYFNLFELMMNYDKGNKELIKAVNRNGKENKKINKKLIKAVNRNEIEEVRRLLEAGADVNAKDHEDHTALILAAFHCQLELVKMLLEAGADVNAKSIGGYTALDEAAVFGHTKIAKLLLEYGAEVDVKDGNGFTALITAARYGHTETVKLLLEAGADINAKNQYGWTALIAAAKFGYIETVELLLKAGAEVDPDDTETMKFIVDHNLDYLVK